MAYNNLHHILPAKDDYTIGLHVQEVDTRVKSQKIQYATNAAKLEYPSKTQLPNWAEICITSKSEPQSHNETPPKCILSSSTISQEVPTL